MPGFTRRRKLPLLCWAGLHSCDRPWRSRPFSRSLKQHREMLQIDQWPSSSSGPRKNRAGETDFDELMLLGLRQRPGRTEQLNDAFSPVPDRGEIEINGARPREPIARVT